MSDSALTAKEVAPEEREVILPDFVEVPVAHTLAAPRARRGLSLLVGGS